MLVGDTPSPEVCGADKKIIGNCRIEKSKEKMQWKPRKRNVVDRQKYSPPKRQA
jgi:hypothetical protein